MQDGTVWMQKLLKVIGTAEAVPLELEVSGECSSLTVVASAAGIRNSPACSSAYSLVCTCACVICYEIAIYIN